ncbi:DUF2628 domain-containing protein [Taklimakanibacter deserti]|uniref:DUF2628 domain-containing protein n=1 Tax=Taklimakanibacter deserti TaxID=2267839 RepID=UPI000E650B2D
MAWWTAHNQPGKGADDVVFLREGFSWWALLFPLPWLVIKGMWIVLLVALGAQFAIWAIAEALGAGDMMRLIFSFAINLILAFEGNNLLRWTYERRGFEELGLVHGDDIDEAEYRFFTEIGLPQAPAVTEVEQPPVFSSRWKPEEPDFIFPGFGRS